ncbi:MAG TPA: ABC transporter substrate-binding protein, partial [Anaerolineales bacterium]|nr:ABC transporter substrate-binding protein [Anaerolineales bacterium]
MKRNILLSLFSVLVLASLILVACQPAAPATEEAAATEEPVATEEVAPFEPMKLEAANCDYGGKIKSVEAVDELTVKFTMCKPDPAFYAKIAFVPFSIQPSEYIMANANEANKSKLLEHPIGTGPWMVDSWNRGDSIVFKRFDGYWGTKAPFETLVFKWATEGAARLLELQSGTVNYITNVGPDDFETVKGDSNLQLLPSANPNTMYLGMTNTFSPFSNLKFRQALAMGIDRQRIVDNYYPEGSEVAAFFTPCSIPNGCVGDEWYSFDPAAAKALLEEALAEEGITPPFKTSIYYRDVFRGYLPEPGNVAVELQTQLKENLGIEAEVVVMESGEFIDEATNGRLDGFYMLGWGADYPHVTNFLDYHFGEANTQFGTAFPEIFNTLVEASQIAVPADAEALYVDANNKIRELVPMVPIAHGASANAALASLEGAYIPPFSAPQFTGMNPGGDTLVYMQSGEPISMYCPDETDGESLAACEQVLESLYRFKKDSGDVEPALATSCDANADSTEFTCHLREGVTFHDGSSLDANDVVVSWMAGLDAASPYHVGNTGAFDYFGSLWDKLMNAPSE